MRQRTLSSIRVCVCVCVLCGCLIHLLDTPVPWLLESASVLFASRLDEEHLTAKCFLLECFLHDVIDGASDPSLVLAFVAK